MSGFTRKESTNISHYRSMHILCHGQAVCKRDTKLNKMTYLMKVGNIAM